ncbi:flavin reductase family protein [Streptomyces sp. NPDC055912]|uniref:flavin reductase family protein n=1 Tax=Streptomyces sp. NPDC055912 TaxID=3345660 RepID=UPI0035D984BD
MTSRSPHALTAPGPGSVPAPVSGSAPVPGPATVPGRDAGRDGGRDASAGVDPADFRAAMARFAAGVVVVTTRAADGSPRGFTATSFCSLSLDPPLVLVCLSHSSSSFPDFDACEEFAVSILRREDEPVARLFATSGADRFPDGEQAHTPSLLPVVSGAIGQLDCTLHARHRAGDHTIMIGRVDDVRLAPGEPLVYYDRAFGTLAPGPHRAP